MNDAAASKPPARYHAAAIALHWVLALLLAYQFALGLRLEQQAPTSEVFTAFQQHKSIGIAILLLSLVRLVLRLTKPRPEAVGATAEQLAARLAHRAFYAIMLLAPLSGWIIVSTAKIKVPTVLFGLIPLPHLPLSAAGHEPAELAHAVLGWALPALVLLHVAAVFYHLQRRDAVPQRMVPAGIGAGAGIAAGMTSLALTLWLGLAGPLPQLWSSLTAAAPARSPQQTGQPSEALAPTPTASAEPDPAASDLAVATAEAKSCEWAVGSASRLGFTANYSGEPVNGTFRNWTARIVFCEDDPGAASIAASISLSSADTADSSRDENLKGPAFFDTATFPRARFNARGFKPLGGGRYATDGTLTLRGKSRPVRLTFTLKVSGDKAQAQGLARLSRLEFGVGTDEWSTTDQIADAVSINFTIAASRAGQ